MPITDEESKAIDAGYYDLLKSAMPHFYERLAISNVPGNQPVTGKDFADAVAIARKVRDEFKAILNM